MGFFNIFGKSTKQKVIAKLYESNMEPMALLLKSNNHPRLSEEDKIYQCNILKKEYNLEKGPAHQSLNRFKLAKQICQEYDFSRGVQIMQDHIELYEIYIKKYCG